MNADRRFAPPTDKEKQVQPTRAEIIDAAKQAAVEEAELVAGRPVSPFLIGVAVEAALKVVNSIHPDFRTLPPGPDTRAA